MKHRMLARKCELFHGNEKTRPYFEGWYFKHVSKQEDFILSVICGVSRSKNPRDDHSFIQVITGPAHKSHYIRFAYNAFEYDRESFNVSVGNNTFSYDQIHLDIARKDMHIKADFKYSNHLRLQNSIFSPSIMGPFSYIPNMECNHGVLSLKNEVQGNVEIDGKIYDMTGAVGYIEKDWGEAFPNAWIWLQGNVSAKKEDAAFMCSVASIPFGLIDFTGLICVLAIDGKQYRFATYNGAKIKSVKNVESGVDIALKRGVHLLEINARSKSFDKLIGPTRNGMTRELFESVAGAIHIKLYKKGKLIFEDDLSGCGMEISEIGELEK